MKKIIELKGLDCANCASKIEEGVRNINGVSYVSVNFMLEKMTLEIENIEILTEVKKVIKKIEPDCEIVEK